MPERRAQTAAAQRRYYARNAERLRVKARERQAARRESMTPEEREAAGSQRWQREQNRPHVRAAKDRERRQVRLDVLAGYGGACACCGTTYEPHLTIDHIAGGGSAERRVTMNIYRRLRREHFPPGYQVLCCNCNWAKHRDRECRCQQPLQAVAS